MRILWLSGNSSSYRKKGLSGGWIYSLEKEIRTRPEIQLGVSFPYKEITPFKEIDNNVTYYPILLESFKMRWCRILFPHKYDELYIKKLKLVISDFKPDIIHIWGSEMEYILAIQITTVPIILHIQGIIATCVNAWFPPGFSNYSIIKNLFPKCRSILNYYISCRGIKYQAKREKKILPHVKYFMGRTNWDKSISELFSSNSTYFYCSEIIRQEFYNSLKWNFHKREKIILTTITLGALFKGTDVILKTANLLKNAFNINFEWRIIGINECNIFSNILGIKTEDNNVKCLGRLPVDLLIKELLNCNFYVHTSYIDNSPNSICEAQFLGVPVIATNVGGVSSLIQHRTNGILVPPNDIYMLCSYIIKYSHDENLTSVLSRNSIDSAQLRHNKNTIINTLINIYNKINYDGNS